MQPHDPRRDPTHHEERGDRNLVENADTFVVGGEQPRPDAVVVVEVVWLGRRGFGRWGRRRYGETSMGNGYAHGFFSGEDVVVGGVVLGAPTALGVRSVRSGV